jgi:hypothetical protein
VVIPREAEVEVVEAEVEVEEEEVRDQQPADKQQEEDPNYWGPNLLTSLEIDEMSTDSWPI